MTHAIDETHDPARGSWVAGADGLEAARRTAALAAHPDRQPDADR